LGITQRVIAMTVVKSLLATIGSKESTASVRGICWLALDDLSRWMGTNPPDAAWEETYAFVTHSMKEEPSKLSFSATPLIDPM